MTIPRTDPITFRPLKRRDMPLMHRWLYTPHVAKWWWPDQAPSAAALEQKYLPRIAGDEPTDCYIIQEDGRDIGYIQTYVIADHPDYDVLVGVAERAAGIDIFIGEPDRVHRGLGSGILRIFMRTIVFADPSVESCIIGPAVSNMSAIRCYEKAGFTFLKTIDVPDEEEPEQLMRIWRQEIIRLADDPVASAD